MVNEGKEIHLDLQCWMWKFGEVMSRFAQKVGDSDY
jgi:hypothetical protein